MLCFGDSTHIMSVTTHESITNKWQVRVPKELSFLSILHIMGNYYYIYIVWGFVNAAVDILNHKYIHTHLLR